MRKRIITPDNLPGDGNWLDLDRLAQVEVTSEDAAHLIESALLPGTDLAGTDLAGTGAGWRAARSGEQTIRLVFDEPQQLRRIHLVFQETEQTRTQEFVLRWSSDGGRTYREIVRQGYNFSPPGTTREVEDLEVNLDMVTVLELTIIPDINGDARASLAQLRLA